MEPVPPLLSRMDSPSRPQTVPEGARRPLNSARAVPRAATSSPRKCRGASASPSKLRRSHAFWRSESDHKPPSGQPPSFGVAVDRFQSPIVGVTTDSWLAINDHSEATVLYSPAPGDYHSARHRPGTSLLASQASYKVGRATPSFLALGRSVAGETAASQRHKPEGRMGPGVYNPDSALDKLSSQGSIMSERSIRSGVFKSTSARFRAPQRPTEPQKVKADTFERDSCAWNTDKNPGPALYRTKRFFSNTLGVGSMNFVAEHPKEYLTVSCAPSGRSYYKYDTDTPAKPTTARLVTKDMKGHRSTFVSGTDRFGGSGAGTPRGSARVSGKDGSWRFYDTDCATKPTIATRSARAHGTASAFRSGTDRFRGFYRKPLSGDLITCFPASHQLGGFVGAVP
mmetsp:Transcript_84/g.269  ORF Transcript_84/g.269 Transcript_84/m.269 type:complete len:398 (-) Transcript_84:751-1944(-)